MRNTLKVFLSALLLSIGSPAIAEIYNFAGPNYDQAYGPYTTSMRPVGFIETSGPLAANAPISDIRALIMAYSFNDGVVTLTQNNSQLCSFNVGTDNTGYPVSGITTINGLPGGIGSNAMDFQFGKKPPPDPMNPLADFIAVGTFVEANALCTSNSYDAANNYATAADGLIPVRPTAPIPTLETIGLLLLILAMGIIGLTTISRRMVSYRH